MEGAEKYRNLREITQWHRVRRPGSQESERGERARRAKESENDDEFEE
jgi:hypothetical protein